MTIYRACSIYRRGFHRWLRPGVVLDLQRDSGILNTVIASIVNQLTNVTQYLGFEVPAPVIVAGRLELFTALAGHSHLLGDDRL